MSEQGQDGGAGQENGKTYYDALGVGRGASPEEVKSAYRARMIGLARSGRSADANRVGLDEAEKRQREEAMKDLNVARDTLSDVRLRAVYDTELRERERERITVQQQKEGQRQAAAAEAGRRKAEAERRVQEETRRQERELRREQMQQNARRAGQRWGEEVARIFYSQPGLQSAQRLADLLGWVGEAKQVFLEQVDMVGAGHI